MQSVILDTNIVVSALIQRSYPHYIVYEYAMNGQMELCLSEELMKEYCDVLSRPKFARIPDFVSNAAIVLKRFENIGTFYKPKIKLEILKDVSDNKLLELADESKADFLVTGNSLDFTIQHYKNTQILSPRSFWEINFENIV